ncbi:hypothetical protein CMK11_05460, partial [Candidatus Poribacteria bacterium]|nr:hypothetical protein [Candidatus Poribacteria bacterium]
ARGAAAQDDQWRSLTLAVERYERQAEDRPEAAASHLMLGLAYLAVDAPDEARSALVRAVELRPDDYAARYWLGRTEFLAGKYPAAVQTFMDLAAHAPARYEAYADWGMALLRVHEYADAEERLARARVLLTEAPGRYRPVTPPGVFEQPDPAWMDKVMPLSLMDIDYYLSRASFEQGDLEAALGHCERSLQVAPSARALFQRGLARSRLGRALAAEQDFAAAAKSDPTLYRAHYQLALLYYRRGATAEGQAAMARFEQLKADATALDSLTQAMLRNVDQTPMLVETGQLHLEAGAYGDAARAFQKALWRDPTSRSALLGLAHAYALQGRFADASAAHAAASELARDSPETAATLGFIRLRQAEQSQRPEDYERALTVYRELAETNGAAAWLQRGQIALKLGRLGESRESLETWLSLPEAEAAASDTRVQAHMALGDICLRQNDLAAAEEQYRHVLRRDSEVADAYFNMGFIAAQTGREAQAVLFYEAVIELAPDMAQAHHLVGRLYAGQGRHGEARAAYLAAIARDPGLAGAYERLAHLEGGLGEDLERALEYAVKATTLRPDSDASLNTLSWIHYLRGEYGQAERAVVGALELAPDNAAYRQGLAAIRRAAGDGAP